MSALIVRAAELAARMHKTQRRSGPEDVPYFNHCAAVAALVSTATEDPEVLAAALLHDTVEDCDIALPDIESLFGARVAVIVGELTDDEAIADLPLFQRKGMQAKKIGNASVEAKMVKIADQTCNLTDIVDLPPGWPPDKKKAYLHGTRLVVDACRGVDAELEAAFDTAAQRLEDDL